MEAIMGDREIKEQLNLMGYGEKPPARLMDVIAVFRKRKGAMAPEPINLSDLVVCTMFYDVIEAKAKAKAKPKEEAENG